MALNVLRTAYRRLTEANKDAATQRDELFAKKEVWAVHEQVILDAAMSRESWNRNLTRHGPIGCKGGRMNPKMYNHRISYALMKNHSLTFLLSILPSCIPSRKVH